MKKLTVFTPTYNRADCLIQCYESLKRQSCKDFTWLIIDDGSTDDTRQMVNEWKKEKEIDIHYHYQGNQGMHGAHNTAYGIIETELNVCIDSDDFMPDDAVEKILNFWEKHGSDEVSGIMGLDATNKNEVIGTRFPQDLRTTTLFDLYNKHDVKGDKKLVYRSKLTRKYPYPTFADEKYVGLAYKYHMLDKDYEMLLMNEILCYVEYLPDGSSRNMLKQYRRNPQGFSFYRKELMKLPFANRLFKFRQAIHYVSSSMLSKNKRFLLETPDKLLTILALPIGTILFLYITSKTADAT
ncbi:glycosyltransferase family 2 protein [Lentibacillus sediminis]|uniref:glycosyltransferase family 2 protein n=1 Tax=Lentibacillus sediminis TaxID=1940529 RepID=UPI000C1C6138|nr:glycosyltransferase family 2 protein [Lentibacillus sediminis]